LKKSSTRDFGPLRQKIVNLLQTYGHDVVPRYRGDPPLIVSFQALRDDPQCVPEISKLIVKYFEKVEKQKQFSPKRRNRSDSFYRSNAWRTLRYATLIKYGNRCMCCGASPKTSKLHVDHIKPRSKCPELELDPTNVQVLCEECNFGKGASDDTDFRDETELT
jgi:5-methylcytosine-specific restriction endonuclease McrA